MKHFILILVMFLAIVAQSQPISLPLWQNQVPNALPSARTEQSIFMDSQRISQVTNPTIEVYLPEGQDTLKTAVLICPGGGYSYLSYDKEGTRIAQKLNENGIAGIVLKYRLPEDELNKVPHLSPLMDAQQAMQLIQAHASDWGIDSKKVGVMGFSAGGHLASTLGTHFQESNRPDFMILIYPVVTMKKDFTHMGSRDNLLGDNPEPSLEQLYSNETQVTRNTPATFIVHSEDDGAVPVENSLQFYAALKANQVPVEMHLYSYGGHGFGLAEDSGRLGNWSNLMVTWIKELK